MLFLIYMYFGVVTFHKILFSCIGICSLSFANDSFLSETAKKFVMYTIKTN